jgi:hypothetical protein
MFITKFSQRLIKWLSSPKTYIVNVCIDVDGKIVYRDVEGVSYSKKQALLEAKFKSQDFI